MCTIAIGLLCAIGLLATGQTVLSCQTLVPAELLNSCIFDALTISAPSTGFTINRQVCNDLIAKSEYAEQPYVYFSNAMEEKTYLVMMIDPDAPNHSVGEFYLHWIVANIPGYILKQGLGYDVGQPIISYVCPDPPAFSGPHRYMVFAYEQLTIMNDIPIPAYRARFSLMDWLETLGGEDVIRGPVASIGFQAEF